MKIHQFDQFRHIEENQVYTVAKIDHGSGVVSLTTAVLPTVHCVIQQVGLTSFVDDINTGIYTHVREGECVVYEERMGGKKLYFMVWPGYAEVMVDCDVCNGCAMVVVRMTDAQAKELIQDRRNRCIQEILPDHPVAIREIFISGHTPLEWDEIFLDDFKLPEEKSPGFKRWREHLENDYGYQFDTFGEDDSLRDHQPQDVAAAPAQHPG